MDVLQLCAPLDQEIVVDFQPDGPDDGEVVADHQVVDLLDGAGGGVLDGHDAVAAQTLFNGGEHALKILEIHDKGHFEQLFTGDLCECALYAADAHGHVLGEQLGGSVDGVVDALAQFGVVLHLAALVGAAQLEEGRVEHAGIIPHFRRHFGAQGAHLLPLPARVQYRQTLFLFIFRDFSRRLHPLPEQPDHLIVDVIHLLAVVF